MSKTVDKIRKMSQEAAAKKAAEENERIQKNVDKDLAVLETILAMVKDRLIYKEQEKPHTRRKMYVVATEEIILHDYANRPEYGTGTEIKQIEGGYYSYPHTLIKVNGHAYYHASDLITKYKYEAQKAMEKLDQERDAARNRIEAVQSLEDLEPMIKELMINYQKHLGIGEAVEAKDGE
jgi:hypothetical protein